METRINNKEHMEYLVVLLHLRSLNVTECDGKMIRNGEEEMILKEVFFVSFKLFYQHSKERRLEANHEKSQTGQLLTIPNTVPATPSHNGKWEQNQQQMKNEKNSQFLNPT